jgi:acetolactate synthase-1/2/3 large subunit
MAKRINRVANAKPIHPDKLGQEIAEFLDPSATIVLDSFTGSSYLTDKIQATFSGQILDSGEHAGVGHGVGMGIGAQVGRPGKQVFVMMGDGGMGVAAMDIETAVRHKLPVVYGVYNNSLWISGYQNNVYGRNNELIGGGPDEGYNQWWYRMLPGIRYDKLAEVIPGLHGEHVESPEEIKPALYRAFNSGKTAVIDFVVDDEIIHPLCTLPSIMVPMVGHVYASPYFDKMPARGRKLMDRMMKGERISPYELFADKYGYSPDEW